MANVVVFLLPSSDPSMQRMDAYLASKGKKERDSYLLHGSLKNERRRKKKKKGKAGASLSAFRSVFRRDKKKKKSDGALRTRTIFVLLCQLLNGKK